MGPNFDDSDAKSLKHATFFLSLQIFLFPQTHSTPLVARARPRAAHTSARERTRAAHDRRRVRADAPRGGRGEAIEESEGEGERRGEQPLVHVPAPK